MATARTAPRDPDFANGPAGPAWTALAEWLDRRSAGLRDEVRDYPTPIARCDVQLTKLLEHRSGSLAASALTRLLESRASGDFPTREAVSAVLSAGPATDEPVENRLRERLRASLSSLPCRD
jgi:hypothetical protein